MIKDMCHEAGIGGHKTNHSLRATGASEVFAAGVPEKIIKERTGHRSLEALHIYEHTSSAQHQAVSTILGSKNKLSYQEAIFPSSSSNSLNYITGSSTPTNILTKSYKAVVDPWGVCWARTNPP